MEQVNFIQLAMGQHFFFQKQKVGKQSDLKVNLLSTSNKRDYTLTQLQNSAKLLSKNFLTHQTSNRILTVLAFHIEMG